MEGLISPSSSSSSLPLLASGLQLRLQRLLQSRPEWWAYVIFWRSAPGPHLVLSFGDGHFRGSRAVPPKRPPALRALGCADDGDEAEWFYAVSLIRSFGAGDPAAPTRAYTALAHVWLTGSLALAACGCDRAREAQLHGLETLAFIPVPGGVLELGSTELIPENRALLQQVKSITLCDDPPAVVPFAPAVAAVAAAALPFSAPQKREGGFGAWGLSSSLDSEHSDSKGGLRADRRRPKKRGRKAVAEMGQQVSHVEAERQRRKMLNHRFYALRSAVPNVSGMDKASLLADAVAYIKELRARVDELKAQAKKGAPAMASDMSGCGGSSTSTTTATVSLDVAMEVKIKMLGPADALIRVQSERSSQAPARLMAALRDMELCVHHASVSGMHEVMLQDVVVTGLPGDLQGEDSLRAALLGSLKHPTS